MMGQSVVFVIFYKQLSELIWKTNPLNQRFTADWIKLSLMSSLNYEAFDSQEALFCYCQTKEASSSYTGIFPHLLLP